jgi:hypothetical protein
MTCSFAAAQSVWSQNVFGLGCLTTGNLYGKIFSSLIEIAETASAKSGCKASGSGIGEKVELKIERSLERTTIWSAFSQSFRSTCNGNQKSIMPTMQYELKISDQLTAEY